MWRRCAAKDGSHAGLAAAWTRLPARWPTHRRPRVLHQALCDLEANSNDLKAELRELYIVSAKEVDVTGRKAVVIFVPFKLLKIVHKIQSRLVREVRARAPREATAGHPHARRPPCCPACRAAPWRPALSLIHISEPTRPY